MTSSQTVSRPPAPRAIRPYRLALGSGVLALASGVGLTLGALGIVPWLLNPMAWTHVAVSAVLLAVGGVWWARHYLAHGRKSRGVQRRTGWLQTLLWLSVLLSGLLFFRVMGDATGTLIFRWVHGLLSLAGLLGFFVHAKRPHRG